MKRLLAFVGTALAIGSTTAHSQTEYPVAPPAVHIERSLPGTQKNAESSLGGVQQPAQVYSHGDPTAEEQYILELINWARANPKAEGDTLANTKNAEIVGAYNYFGKPTPSQVRADFQTYPAQPPLAFNANLISAARGHSQDMLDHNFQSHTGFNGSTFDQRLNAAGYTGWDGAGENIFAYGKSLFGIHANFQIDFGNDNLGHRQNIMNFTGALFREIGIGLLHGGTGSPNVGPIITTEDFGVRPDKTFLLGVVYDDKNKNGFYDIGEGVSGVTITATGTTWTTVTSTSGGYALPYTTAGSVTVSATGSGLPGTIKQTVNFQGENVKVDFTPAMSGLPGAVVLVSPTESSTVKAESAKLVWNKITGATNYHLQFGIDTVVADMLVDDATLTDTTRTVANLVDGVEYFWRIQAKNSKGWGEWSEFSTFTAALPARKVVLVSPATGTSTASPVLIWNTSTPNVTSYRLEVYPNSSMVNPIVNDSTVTDTTYTIAAALTPGTTYYWRVTGKNSNGWGTVSETRTFKYTGLGVTDDRASEFSVSADVMENVILFRISGAESSKHIELFDATGHKAFERTSSSNEIACPSKSLTAGVYFYRVSSGSQSATGRVLVRGIH